MSFEFSIRGYEHLLDSLAEQRYGVVTFRDLPRTADAGVCVLRHDVDATLDFAMRLADIEAGRGIRATYFVMLRSPLYNALSRQATAELRQLAAAGHEVGLHFDNRDGDQGEGLEQRISRDLAILSDQVGAPVSAFSFHQPTADLLARRVSVPGAINAYSIGDSGYRYVSDSNRDWRGSDVAEYIRQRTPLQLLVHPMWWVCNAPHVFDCWDAALTANFDRQQRHLAATEGAFGPERRLQLARAAAAAPAPASRAYLAPLTDADVPVLFSWINDRDLAVLNAPFHPVHQADHEEWFRTVRSRPDLVIFGVRRAADQQLVGSCQLHSIDRVHRSAELQIRIGVADARRAGIGTDACLALLKHAFEDLNLRRVYLHVLGSNEPARRLYARLGFAVDGVAKEAVFIDGRWQDLVTMSIRRADE